MDSEYFHKLAPYITYQIKTFKFHVIQNVFDQLLWYLVYKFKFSSYRLIVIKKINLGLIMYVMRYLWMIVCCGNDMKVWVWLRERGWCVWARSRNWRRARHSVRIMNHFGACANWASRVLPRSSGAVVSWNELSMTFPMSTITDHVRAYVLVRNTLATSRCWEDHSFIPPCYKVLSRLSIMSDLFQQRRVQVTRPQIR